MNVFGTIKAKFGSVPQNISAGLKSWASKEEEREDLACDGVTLNAGAELLNKFQEYWAEIHENSEINAKKAEEVDSVINKMYLEIERQNETMNEFLSHTSNLPEIVLSIDAAMELIGELNGKVSDLESGLAALENTCDELEIRRNRELHLNELKLYRERKAVEIEQVKAKLAREHADRAAAHETRLQATLQEKQAIFESTYTEAMEDYKLFGQSRLNTTKQLKKKHGEEQAGDLSTIVLEQDTAALDDFLATDTEKSESEDQTATDSEKDVPKEAGKDAEKETTEPSQKTTEPEAGDASMQVSTKTESPETETETKPKKETEPETGATETKGETETESGATETKSGEMEESEMEEEDLKSKEHESEKEREAESKDDVENKDSRDNNNEPGKGDTST